MYHSRRSHMYSSRSKRFYSSGNPFIKVIEKKEKKKLKKQKAATYQTGIEIEQLLALKQFQQELIQKISYGGYWIDTEKEEEEQKLEKVVFTKKEKEYLQELNMKIQKDEYNLDELDVWYQIECVVKESIFKKVSQGAFLGTVPFNNREKRYLAELDKKRKRKRASQQELQFWQDITNTHENYLKGCDGKLNLARKYAFQ